MMNEKKQVEEAQAMDLVKIGRYIAEKRKAAGLTQRQLAERLNMSDKSVSKWERGVCLPNVAVYKELCEILGISINEFLAGEDIGADDLVSKSEENLIQVTKDGDHRTHFMKRVIAVLSAVIFVVVLVCGYHIYRYASQPKNYVEPLDPDSVQMKTAELQAGVDGAYLYRYVTGDQFQKLMVYVSEYREGELISKEPIGYIDYADMDSPKNGMISIVPDFEHFRVKLVVADDSSKLSAELPILEGVKGRKYYGRSATQIKGLTEITYGAEQGVAALLYGKDHISAISLDELEAGHMMDGVKNRENEYIYYFSLEFSK